MPPELTAIIGKRCLTGRTTGTADLELAMRIARPVHAEFQITIDKARRRLMRVNIKHSDPVTKSTEWYTPESVFKTMQGVVFDLDPCSPGAALVPWVPAIRHITKAQDGLAVDWGNDFAWCNPPFGIRQGMQAWLDKFVKHRNGLILLPANTYTRWWRRMAEVCDAVLFITGHMQFLPPLALRERYRKSKPAFGSCIFAMGERGVAALEIAARSGLGPLSPLQNERESGPADRHVNQHSTSSSVHGTRTT